MNCTVLTSCCRFSISEKSLWHAMTKLTVHWITIRNMVQETGISCKQTKIWKWAKKERKESIVSLNQWIQAVLIESGIANNHLKVRKHCLLSRNKSQTVIVIYLKMCLAFSVSVHSCRIEGNCSFVEHKIRKLWLPRTFYCC